MNERLFDVTISAGKISVVETFEPCDPDDIDHEAVVIPMVQLTDYGTDMVTDVPVSKLLLEQRLLGLAALGVAAISAMMGVGEFVLAFGMLGIAALAAKTPKLFWFKP